MFPPKSDLIHVRHCTCSAPPPPPHPSTPFPQVISYFHACSCFPKSDLIYVRQCTCSAPPLLSPPPPPPPHTLRKIKSNLIPCAGICQCTCVLPPPPTLSPHPTPRWHNIHTRQCTHPIPSPAPPPPTIPPQKKKNPNFLALGFWLESGQVARASRQSTSDAGGSRLTRRISPPPRPALQ